MTPEQVFAIANPVAVIGWVLLAVLPDRQWVTGTIAGRGVPALFAAAYLAIVVAVLPGASGSFSTLDGVAALFTNPWLLLAGWLHYLAFDLFIGAWEAQDSVERGVPRWILVPCLFLTFMLGPAGWLLYVVARTRFPRVAVAS